MVSCLVLHMLKNPERLYVYATFNKIDHSKNRGAWGEHKKIKRKRYQLTKILAEDPCFKTSNLFAENSRMWIW